MSLGSAALADEFFASVPPGKPLFFRRPLKRRGPNCLRGPSLGPPAGLLSHLGSSSGGYQHAFDSGS